MKHIIYILTIVLCSQTYSQEKEIINKFKFRTHTYDTTTIPYRLFIPETNEKSKMPLVIALHGSGERGDDNKKQIEYHRLATSWADPINQKGNPCFVAAPQCPVGNRWVDVDWKKDSYSFEDISISNELLTVNDLIDSLIQEFPIDQSRIYITGLSMGGFGTWYMIMKYPHRFAAAIPMSGTSSPQTACIIKNIPIWNFHGEVDKAVPVGGSRKIISALEECADKALYIEDPNSSIVLNNATLKQNIMNSKLLYTEYKGKGHAVWTESYNNPLLIEWLFSKKLSENN